MRRSRRPAQAMSHRATLGVDPTHSLRDIRTVAVGATSLFERVPAKDSCPPN